ncbi:hypothetical protein [Microbacterium sp. 179-I 3D4 NHS]|uniref:hypothetical protein n=1 Tax=Microbacterium sp. 179-I 3D4 NHS TaxID=3142381 RepID=UPI00399FC10F
MTDVEELRALQRKAYGPEGGLTGAEASRLDVLQERVRLSSAGSAVAAEPRDPVAGTDGPPVEDRGRTQVVPVRSADIASPVPSRSGSDPSDPAPDADGAAAGSSGSAGWRSRPLREQWRLALGAAAVLLAVGVGAGWMLFAPHSGGIPLTAEQEERGRDFADAGDFDPGTLRAVGRDEDAVAWYGTKKDGELACLLLDVGGVSDTECVTAADVQPFALSTSVMAPVGTTDDGGEPTSVSAYVALSTDGQPMVGIHRWTAASTVLSGFAGDERDRAEELVADGYVGNLSIIGSFADGPVWLAERFTDESEPETCLIVDGADRATQCAPSETARQDGISVVAVDGGRDPSRATVLTLSYTQTQVPYLTIAENVETTAIRVEGDRLDVGGEHGDPIEVRSDDPDN